MNDWAGFTDSDLMKLKTQTHSDALSNARLAPKRQQQPPVAVGQRRPVAGNQRKPAARKITPVVTTPPTINPDQMLSKPTSESKKTQPLAEADLVTAQSGQNNNNTVKPPPSTDTGSHRHSQDGSTTEEASQDNEKDLITDDEEIFKHESHSMESFQKQQKMIEELNKKKKQMLASAIQERAKKAKAESAKLIELQKELNKLDQLLTVDVSIMRDKIESACRDFFDAQKRYDRAEKEYVESKIDLHHKMQHKEQLTEHLYTVIYQNEMRKSKKLGELMAKLEMEDGENVMEIPECDMPHPSLISPVQLPMGRYGQIGLVKVDVTKATAEEGSKGGEGTEGEKKDPAAEKDASTGDKGTSSDSAASSGTSKEENTSTASGSKESVKTPDTSSTDSEKQTTQSDDKGTDSDSTAEKQTTQSDAQGTDSEVKDKNSAEQSQG